ncbi:MAG: hypothetical protein DI536_12770 [Archangium gephyra]|uniref:BIG2 domain-containing protein n=1 Tax=Archangium gephyra TaxID=48 RepID=A0A2W5VCC0_9BACT|nr:MAG: hypothetical protein DI536_12770 [Archangium gephyra]
MKTTPLLLLALLAACAPQPQAERVETLRISPANGRVARGESLRYVATALLSTGEVRDVTNETVWTIDDDFVGVTTGGSSVVQGVNMGRTRVRAQYLDLMDARPLDVVQPQYRALRLEPSQLLVPLGLELPIRLVAIASDGTEVDVTAEASVTLSQPELASVRAGRITPLRPGVVTVELTAKDLAVSAQLVVTDAIVAGLELRAEQGDLPAGFSQQLSARATLSDGQQLDVTRAAVWSSEAPAIGTVDASGRFVGVAPGSVRITATTGGVTAAASVKVTDAVPMALAADASPQRLPAGLRTSLRALATMSDGSLRDVSSQVTWSNEDASKLEQQGSWARGLVVGSVTVTASLGSLSASTRVEVIDAVLTRVTMAPLRALPLGASWQAAALAHWSDGTTSNVSRVTAWQVNDPTVASVDAEGLVTARHVGQAQLIGFFGGQVVVTRFTVTPAALSSLDVSPSSLRLVRGSTAQVRVTATWTDGTRLDVPPQSCVWATPVAQVASVSPLGLVTARSPGAGRVFVTCLGIRRVVQVRVPDVFVVDVTLTPQAPSLPVGFGRNMTLRAALSDGSSQDVTFSALWRTTDPSIAVASAGVVSAARVGTTTLRAEFGGEHAETPVIVTSGVLQSLELTPSTLRATPGQTLSVTALGRFSDGATLDMTSELLWASADETIATVNAGALHAIALGDVEISASAGDVLATAQLSVVAPSLSYLVLSPAPALPVGRSHDLTLQGVMNDGSVQTLTSAAQWSSSVPGVAAFSSTAGRVSAVSPGAAIVTARIGQFTTSLNLFVTGATPASLSLDASSQTLALSESARLTAWAYYSDGSRFDVTAECTWLVANGAVVSVSPSGHAQALAAGSSTITAQWGNFSGSTTLQVSAAPTVLALSVVGGEFVQPGDTASFTAWAEYSDGTTREVTAEATWSSSNAAVLSSTGGGTFSAVAPGTATVTATLGAQSGSATVTVIVN